MKFLVLLTPAVGRDPAEFKPYAVAEMQAVWHDYKAGALREIYFSPSPVIVSVIYETSARDELETLVARLPMVEPVCSLYRLLKWGRCTASRCCLRLRWHELHDALSGCYSGFTNRKPVQWFT